MGNPRKVVTRMLKYFQNEGMVKLSRGTIEITDERKLMALMHMEVKEAQPMLYL